MRRILPLVFLLSLLAATASAGSDVTEIRLGKAPPPPPPVDRAKIHAVARFLSARQAASFDASRRGEARRLIAPGAGADDAALLGAKGTRIIAFDFQDEGIEPLFAGEFEVPVHLVLADHEGEILEGRDELLTFAPRGGEFRCVTLKQTNVMDWGSDAVARDADSLNARQGLEQAEAFLRRWVDGQPRPCGYSLEDLRRSDRGLLVQCRRFTAEMGRRGCDVTDSPLLVTQSAGEYHVESN
jgi:hypothetical protein